MSNAENIAKAAAELDKLVGKFWWLKADWRSKINLSNLYMYDSKNCILGQLQGDYESARSAIRVYKPGFDFSPFEGYTTEWKEYLKGEVPVVGQTWTDKNKCCFGEIKSLLQIDGVDYVVYRDQYSSIVTIKVSEFKSLGWTLKPKYNFKAGDLLTFGQDKDNLYIFLDVERVLRLNQANGGSSSANFDWYLKNKGEPKKVGNAASVLDFVKSYF